MDNSNSNTSPNFVRGVRFWAIIIGLGITNLLGALENTVVTTSAPVIVTDLGIGDSYIWITNAFFVARYEASLSSADYVPSSMIYIRQ